MKPARRIWIVFTMFCLVAPIALAQTNSPKQGAELLKTDILGVFAHPDDESGVSAVMAKYALGEGKAVSHVYCTRGEGGGNMVGTQWGASLGILREIELRECLAHIGVQRCFFLDRLDWAYTESVAATFNNWNKEETLGRLVRHIRALRPEIIITMNPAPTPGQHGHHQAAAVLATEAFDAAADASRFPEQIKVEGLTTWQPRKLYYGGNLPPTVAIMTTNIVAQGKTASQIAGEAARNHRSQGFGNFGGGGNGQPRPHNFTLVKTAVAASAQEQDLFDGLPVGGSPLRVPIDGPQVTKQKVEVRFVPRPAVRRYQEWIAHEGIEHVAMKIGADVPVVCGERNQIAIEVRNNSNQKAVGELELSAPEGWRWQKGSLPYSLLPSQAAVLHAELICPTDASADADITAVAGEVKATGRVHPTPHATVATVKSAPKIDASGTGWENVSTIAITPKHLVQGRVANDADSSGVVRLAHDGSTLFVDIDVKDDHVVSNIAPNDIRGHWRSDSVEICIDPQAGAEDTMGCYKLGIFPFDTGGKVRAARDADAKQGPIEETAPRTRIASRRTADGYRIQAAIPFSEIGISPRNHRRLGFNVIIYDGDKADAAIGENINKSRIAWAPRSGVNGRPEDWGRIDLQ